MALAILATSTFWVARRVLEEDFKNGQLATRYDSVLIPALSMIEQDRHRDVLEEASEKFIFQSTKEIIEEQFERYAQRPARELADVKMDTEDLSEIPEVQNIQSQVCKVICVPAGDEADEIVGIMLAQLVKETGYHAQCIAVGVPLEILAQLSQEGPDIVCISALPPFAIGSARTLYQTLWTEMPQIKTLVGLWNFAGDAKRAANRIGTDDAEDILTTLAQAARKITVYAEAEASDAIVRQGLLRTSP